MPAAPKYAPAANWSKDKRFKEAIKKVLYEEWTQGKAAEYYGVSRTHLNLRLKEARAQHESALERARDEMSAKAGNLAISNEKRRVPDPVTFHKMYFGHLQCPDCGTPHDMPAFHEEIIGLCQDPEILRGGVNLPPFHAKTTVGSIRDTIYDIVRDPNSRTMIISKSQDFSRRIMGAIQEHLTNEDLYDGAGGNLIKDWGPFNNGQSTWNSNMIYVAGRSTSEKDATVQALGYGNQIYGRRADKLKFDDIADTDNQRNPQQVLQMLEWIDKMALSRIGKRGRALWFGTRVGGGDIYSTLSQRQGYRWVKYPFVLDDDERTTLWPEHMPYSYAMVVRDENSPENWQLIYQNVDTMGSSASFTPEAIDSCKNSSRIVGQWDSGWRLIAGLDPAGGNKDSGFTAFALVAVDLRTGRRFIVDSYAQKGMRAPDLRDFMFEWTDRYPIYEWRVESNSVQSQIVQYNEEIIRHLAQKGVRVVPHITTGHNKWDPQFGVESMGPLFNAELYDIPWGTPASRHRMQPLIEQMLMFPLGTVTDRIMALWFAELGCRDLLRRGHLPLWDEKADKWPARIRRRRRVVDFNAQEVRPVPLHDQRRDGATTVGSAGYRRQTVGRPGRHRDVIDLPSPAEIALVNRDRTLQEVQSEVRRPA